jgi:peptide/nickel transport system substrate-binding protein
MDANTILDINQSGKLKRYRLQDGSNNVMVINLNMSHANITLREIFRNKSFRAALSHAINRQEILDFIYQGEGEPWQAAPRLESPFYDPAMGLLFTEYSVEKANQFLDSAGFQKDQVGNRLGPDGVPISFSVMVLDNQPQQIAMLNMIAKYWSEIGIDMRPKVESLPLYQATVRSNLHEGAAWLGGSTFFSDVLLDPSNYLPNSENAMWAVSWANWFNSIPGFENEVPITSARKSLEMYDRIRSVRDAAEQMRLMKGAMLVARESFWTIGIALGPEQSGLVADNFKNVPDQMPASWLYPDPAPTNPEQYFISQTP